MAKYRITSLPKTISLSKAQYGGLHKFVDGGSTDCPKNHVWDKYTKKCVKVYTLANDQKFIDGVGNWAMHSDVPISMEHNEQIKHYLYSGKYGYDPVSGSLYPLKKEQKTVADAETKKILAKQDDKAAYRQSIIDAGFDPETFGKSKGTNVITGEKIYGDKSKEDVDKINKEAVNNFVTEGHRQAILESPFNIAANFTPMGMAAGVMQGGVALLPDAYNFAKDPSWSGAGAIAMDALMMAPAGKGIGKFLGFKGVPKELPGSPNVISSVDDVGKLGDYQRILDKGLDIHDVRLKYHNNMVLDFDEQSMIHKFGKGNKANYEGALVEDISGKMHTDDLIPKTTGKLSGEGFIDSIMGTEQSKVIIPNKNISFNESSNSLNPALFIEPEKNIIKANKFELPSFYSKPYERTSTSRASDKWLEDWFTNPATKQKFIDYGGTEEEWKDVINSLENPIKSNYKWGKNQPGGVYIRPFDQASIPLDAGVDIGVHEGIHKAKLLLDKNNPILHRLWNDLVDAVRLTPSEAYPEIFRFRQKLGLKPGQTIDLKTMEDNLHLISDGYSMSYKIKDKNKLLEIINNAPAVLPAAIGLGAASQMQQNKYGGALDKFVDGGENDKDKKKRKWFREGKRKGMYVSQDDPNLKRYDYLEGLNMTAEEFSEKYPNYSSSALYLPEVTVTQTSSLSEEGKKLYDQAYKSVQNFNSKVAGYPNYSNNSNDWTGPNSQERADLLGAAITESAFKNVIEPRIRTIDKAIQNATVVMDNGTGSSNKKLYTPKYLKKVEAEYEKWLKAPEGDDRQVGNPAYWAPGQLKSAFSVDTYGNGTWTPGYGPRRQPASAANNYNDGPLEGFHPEVVFMAPAGSLAAIPEALGNFGTSLVGEALTTALPLGEAVTAATAGTLTPLNLIASHYAADAVVNQFPEAISDAGKGEYSDALEKIIYGTLGVTGLGLGKGMVSGVKNLGKSSFLKNPTVIPEQTFKKEFVNIYNPKTKSYNVYEINVPQEAIPGRSYADVQHKMKNLRKDLGIGPIEHFINKKFGVKGGIGLDKDAGMVINNETGRLYDSNTRYWLNREYGINSPAPINKTQLAKNNGKLVEEGLTYDESQELLYKLKNFKVSSVDDVAINLESTLPGSPNASAVAEPFEIAKKRILNSSNNFNRIIKTNKTASTEPAYVQQEFAFPVETPIVPKPIGTRLQLNPTVPKIEVPALSAKLTNEQKIMKGMEQASLTGEQTSLASEQANALKASAEIPKTYPIINPDYFTYILSKSNVSKANRKFYTEIIDTVKAQGNVASEAQKNMLERIRSGNFNYNSNINKLKEYGGSIEIEIEESDIDKYVKGGYIVEDISVPSLNYNQGGSINRFAGGGEAPSTVWRQYTGTSWSEAKKQGLTDGSAKANLALRDRLLAGEFGEAKMSNEEVAARSDAYKNMVGRMISRGATLEELVTRRIGTKEGLTNMFSELSTPVKEDLSKYAAQIKPKGIPLPIVFPKQIEKKIETIVKEDLKKYAATIAPKGIPLPKVFPKQIEKSKPLTTLNDAFDLKFKKVAPLKSFSDFGKNKPIVVSKIKKETPVAPTNDVASWIKNEQRPGPNIFKQSIAPVVPKVKTKSNFEKDLLNRLTTIAKQKALLKPEPISKVEPIPNSMAAQFSRQDFNKKYYDANGKEIKPILWDPDHTSGSDPNYKVRLEKEKARLAAEKAFIPVFDNSIGTQLVDQELYGRQKQDNERYGKFMKRGKDIANRTDVQRNIDSEQFFADIAKPNSVIIDIGSALGNSNSKLAGVSVWELTQNPKIKQKKIKVIATDLPDQVESFKEHIKNKKAYNIDYAEVPMTFNTPIYDVLKTKNLGSTKDVYLRAANSIDLLMTVAQTKEHFYNIAKSLKDKNVTYVYNNMIWYKSANSTSWSKIGNINNAAFDHNSASWKTNKNRKPYALINDETGVKNPFDN